jgi:hypothetical protein
MDAMKNCKKYRLLISRYVDNDLNDQENQLLMDHFPSCMKCLNVLNDYSMLRGFIKEYGVFPVFEKAALKRKHNS